MSKEELIEKATGGITKLTSVAHQRTLAFCLVICLIIIFWQRYDNNKLMNRLIDDTSTLNEKRIEEIKAVSRLESRRVVQEEVVPKVDSMRQKVDTVTESAKGAIQVIKEKLR